MRNAIGVGRCCRLAAALSGQRHGVALKGELSGGIGGLLHANVHVDGLGRVTIVDAADHEGQTQQQQYPETYMFFVVHLLIYYGIGVC